MDLVLLSALEDIARANPGLLKLDLVTFRVTIPTTGTITQPSSIKLRNNFDYYVIGLRAGMTGGVSTTAGNLDDADEIRFNMTESGTGETMFSTDVELVTLVDPVNGTSVPLKFDPFGYKMASGSDLSIEWKRRADITLERDVSLCLKCVLVPKGFRIPPGYKAAS